MISPVYCGYHHALQMQQQNSHLFVMEVLLTIPSWLRFQQALPAITDYCYLWCGCEIVPVEVAAGTEQGSWT
jgi:hypothetical protein